MTPPAHSASEALAEASAWTGEQGLPKAPSIAITGHGRLHFMDNLRVALTVLIIFQHSSFAYAPANWWYYSDAQQQPLLAAFFVVNRSFRMSLFFLVAGYFMPYVFDRKGPRLYLKDRFRRFGIPILVFLFIVVPFLMYAYFINFRPYGSIGFVSYYFHYYWGFSDHHPDDWAGVEWPDRNIAHLWFIEMLLIYAVIYAGWRWLRHALALNWPRPIRYPGPLTMIILIAVIAAVTYWVRLHYAVFIWRPFLGFIQVSPADLPRDLACFLFGVLAFRNDWLRRIPASTGYRWLALGVACAALFDICDLTGHSFFSVGGTSTDAKVYALWETVTCFGFALGLPVLFREKFDFRNWFTDKLSAASYGVYVIHLPLVVALQYAMGPTGLSAIAKFLLVAVIAVPVSFALTMLLRRSALLRQVV